MSKPKKTKKTKKAKPNPKRLIGVKIDIESKSGTDISAGSYRYAEDPDFEVLIIAYAPIWQYEGGATKLGVVRLVDLNDPTDCERFARVLRDPRFQKHAFNANFERVALSRWLGMGDGSYLDPKNWYCSAVRANVHGVFGSLDEVAKAVRSRVNKDASGRRLIKLFSTPMSERDQKTADKTCGCQRFHSPALHPDDFEMFKAYCAQDVVTEAMAAAAFPDPPAEVQAQYEADQRINDRGIRHHRKLAEQAVTQVQTERDRLMGDLKDLTGLDNPNSNPQMMTWLEDQGYKMTSLDKAHREEALADPTCPEIVVEALTLKGAASLSSVSKHKAALKTRCNDGRIRGSLAFHRAHTGREAGRAIQPQNLPRYEAPPKDRKRLLKGRAGRDAPTIAKGTVRASLIPAKGHVFVTCDYNAIEARVLAGLAAESWAEAEFRGSGKIYERTAVTMFKVNYDRLVAALKACDKCGKLSCDACVTRGKGKVSNLALGYAGGAGALVTMGAEEAGIDIGNYKELHAEWTAQGKPGKFHEWNVEAHDYPELLRLRDLYRTASPATVSFWKQCANAWDRAATQGKPVRFGQNMCLAMVRDGRHNRLVLPSGRSIWYRYAIAHADAESDRIDRRTFIGKSQGVGHVRTDTHGGKLTENVTQAVARDVLFDLIMRIEALTAAGWPGRLVLHVHDEVVLEVPEKHAEQVLADTVGMMGQAPSWGDFLIVRGEGKIMERYGK